MLRFALPSDGELHEPTLAFLKGCGLQVLRPNPRRYTGSLAELAGSTVLFQRTADITGKVEDGSAELGVVGMDRYLEFRRDGSEAVVVIDDLGFGRAELVLAVPEEWLDVESIADLADVAAEFHESGRALRVATKYPRLAGRFLLAQDVHGFALVHSSGTLEAAPAMGYADVIADISSTGVTLRENGLKRIEGGTVITSQACLIANRALLRADPASLETTRTVLECVEAKLRADRLCTIRSTLSGPNSEGLLAKLVELGGKLGIEHVTTRHAGKADGPAIHMSAVVQRQHLQEVVGLLREGGAGKAVVGELEFAFTDECQAYRRLLAYGEGVERA